MSVKQTLYLSDDNVPEGELVHAFFDVRDLPEKRLWIEDFEWHTTSMGWTEAVKLAKAILEADRAQM